VPHETQLIATIAVGLGLAFLLGLLALRVKLPLILGYLVAGLAIGPFTPGFVADASLAHQLSEIGVSLLMFGVGLHFSIPDLLAVRRVAIPGAIVQITAATLLGLLLSQFWGWTLGAGIVFGICLSVASTVVLLRALAQRDEIESINGRIAVGWLIVEDLVTVLALVLLPALAPYLGGPAPTEGAQVALPLALLTTVGKVGAFVVAMLLLGKRLVPRLLGRVARTGSRELFTVGVLAIALGIAFGAAALFGVSPALGAFFAGIVIGESDLSHQAGIETRPVQDAFSVLFFVSIGMMFDPRVLLEHPLEVLTTLGVVMVGKSLAAFLIVLRFSLPVSTALIISASLAQIGEFSFILVALGIRLELLPAYALSIVLAVAILSIALNPLVFATVEPVAHWFRQRNRLLRILERKKDASAIALGIDPHTLRHHAVLVGYGRVGRTIAKALTREHIPFVVLDEDLTVCELAQSEGVQAMFGDASRPELLAEANVKEAQLLIVATPAKSLVHEVVKNARKINPKIVVCARTHDYEEAVSLEQLGLERIVLGELELALEMAEFSLQTFEKPMDEVHGTIESLRSLGSDALSRTAN
jgi:CPA2 family monovalent cation:H+ antiporter-2